MRTRWKEFFNWKLGKSKKMVELPRKLAFRSEGQFLIEVEDKQRD
jgi:hypothetical protein